MTGLFSQQCAVRLLGIVQPADALVGATDVVCSRHGLRRVGPIVYHRLKAFLDGRVGLAQFEHREAPLQLRVAGRLAHFVERQILFVLGRRYFPLLLLKVVLGDLELVSLNLGELGPTFE